MPLWEGTAEGVKGEAVTDTLLLVEMLCESDCVGHWLAVEESAAEGLSLSEREVSPVALSAVEGETLALALRDAPLLWLLLMDCDGDCVSEKECAPEAVGPGEAEAPPEALVTSVPVKIGLPLTVGLRVRDRVGGLLWEGASVYDRLPLGVREGAEADGEVDPAPPPGVALGLADWLTLLEAADEGETGEADTEGLPEGEAVRVSDPVGHWLFEAEPVMERLAVGEREQLAVTLCAGDCEAQGLALGDTLEAKLAEGQGEAVAEALPLRLALGGCEAEGVLV